MANSISHAALPYPIKGARYTVLVPLLDADGDPTAQTTPDTEISEDGAAAADAAEEVTAVSGMDGMGYITFTGAETDCTLLAANFKAASGPKATLMTIAPAVLAEVGTGTLSAGSAGGGTLGSLLAYDVTGCFIKTTGGTGGGGAGGADNQARKIVTYNTSTGAFTVSPNWETTPSTDTTYAILLPEGVTLGMLRALNPTTAGRTLNVDSNGKAPATVAAGDLAASSLTASALAADAVTEIRDAITGGAYPLDTDANGRVRIVDGTAAGELDTSGGAVTVGALAANVITAAATAADFGAEVAGAVWDEALAGHLAAGSTGEALNAAGSAGDPWVTALPGAYGAGSAGFILGTNLNATISSRASQASVDTVGGYIDTEIATIITHLTDIKGATFSGVTDSLEAIRNQGDAAWITATGFSTHSAADVWAAGTRTLTAATNLGFPTNFSALAITAGGAVTAGTVSDKTGYSLTQSFPTNFASLSITAGGVVSADAKAVNGVTLGGTGVLGDEWGPA